MKLAATSFVLLILQLALVSSIAAKYLYQRLTCPRVWTRAVAYDPEMVLRGRYLSLRLTVDGCGRITPPPALKADAKNPNARSQWMIFSLSDRYSVHLAVEGNKLVAIPRSGPLEKPGYGPVSRESGQENVVLAPPGASCDALQLQEPVDFYIAEKAADPSRLTSGQELWVEVTIPPKGPPRPIQLALKQNSQWKPLASQ